MTTGSIRPRVSLVWSLNFCTNWPMLTPCWPRAGPTGGAGVAMPPGHCSLICALTSFAMRPSFFSAPSLARRACCCALARASGLQLLHLVVFQIHGDRPAEDGQLHLDLADR